jgi:hypothetical protein
MKNNDKEKNNILEFKTKEEADIYVDAEFPEESEPLILELGEDFNFTQTNLNEAMALFYMYRAFGLCDEMAAEALYNFIEDFGECLDWKLVDGEEPKDK